MKTYLKPQTEVLRLSSGELMQLAVNSGTYNNPMQNGYAD